MKTNYDWACDTKQARWTYTPSWMTKPDFYTYTGQTINPGFEQIKGRQQRWYDKPFTSGEYCGGLAVDGRDITIIQQDKKFYSQNKVNAEEQERMNTHRKVARDATTVGVHVICLNKNNSCRATYEAGTINKLLYNRIMKAVGAWELWKKHISKK